MLKFMNDNKETSKTFIDDWNTLTAEFVKAREAEDEPAPAAERPEEVVATDNSVNREGDDGNNPPERKRYKDDSMYRPKQMLCSNDGVLFFNGWKDTLETYFLMCGHDKKEPPTYIAIACPLPLVGSLL